MAASSRSLEKLQSYANKIIDETEYHTSSNVGWTNYHARLQQALAKLRSEVDEEASKVEKVCQSPWSQEARLNGSSFGSKTMIQSSTSLLRIYASVWLRCRR